MSVTLEVFQLLIIFKYLENENILLILVTLLVSHPVYVLLLIVTSLVLSEIEFANPSNIELMSVTLEVSQLLMF